MEKNTDKGSFMDQALKIIGVKKDEPAEEQLREGEPMTLTKVVPSDVDSTLAQRGTRYGKFSDNSMVYMRVMQIVHASPAFQEGRLSPAAYHALGNIATKLSRLLTGDPNYDDNWRDIAGYATLMVRICNGEER